MKMGVDRLKQTRQTPASLIGCNSFVQTVAASANIDSEEVAKAAILATMVTLSERLPVAVADQLLEQLALQSFGRLRNAIIGRGQHFTLSEFFARVAMREGVDLPTAIHHSRAVMAALNERLSLTLRAQIFDQLPADYQLLITASPKV